jgi:uncharacterized membrane protein required for colicin V production
VGEIAPVDILVGTLLALAILRGFFLGLVREAFSLGSLCGAYFAVVLFVRPTADWILRAASGRIDPAAAPWIAGAILAVGAVALGMVAGRLLRRGVRAAGLSWFDRLGGGLLGMAEGLVVSAVLIALVAAAVGRDHPLLARTRSLLALERAEEIAASEGVDVDVAAPPRPSL